MTNRVIQKEQSKGCVQWETPVMSSNAPDSTVKPVRGLKADKLEKLQEDARKEGFESGVIEGRAAGKAEFQQQNSILSEMIQMFRSPLQDLDESVTRELVELSKKIALHIIRREINIDSAQIVGIVQEALSVVPPDSDNIKIFMHPTDVLQARTFFQGQNEYQGLSVIDDPTLTPGGCRVQTRNSLVNASIEARIASLFADRLGGLRETDESLTQ